jgi:hypothetical protein
MSSKKFTGATNMTYLQEKRIQETFELFQRLIIEDIDHNETLLDDDMDDPKLIIESQLEDMKEKLQELFK